MTDLLDLFTREIPYAHGSWFVQGSSPVLTDVDGGVTRYGADPRSVPRSKVPFFQWPDEGALRETLIKALFHVGWHGGQQQVVPSWKRLPYASTLIAHPRTLIHMRDEMGEIYRSMPEGVSVSYEPMVEDHIILGPKELGRIYFRDAMTGPVVAGVIFSDQVTTIKRVAPRPTAWERIQQERY